MSSFKNFDSFIAHMAKTRVEIENARLAGAKQDIVLEYDKLLNEQLGKGENGQDYTGMWHQMAQYVQHGVGVYVRMLLELLDEDTPEAILDIFVHDIVRAVHEQCITGGVTLYTPAENEKVTPYTILNAMEYALWEDEKRGWNMVAPNNREAVLRIIDRDLRVYRTTLTEHAEYDENVHKLFFSTGIYAGTSWLYFAGETGKMNPAKFEFIEANFDKFLDTFYLRRFEVPVMAIVKQWCAAYDQDLNGMKGLLVDAVPLVNIVKAWKDKIVAEDAVRIANGLADTGDRFHSDQSKSRLSIAVGMRLWV